MAGITRSLNIGRFRDAMSMIEISALGRSEDLVDQVDGRDETYFLGMVFAIEYFSLVLELLCIVREKWDTIA
jgi:hypothetical protein